MRKALLMSLSISLVWALQYQTDLSMGTATCFFVSQEDKYRDKNRNKTVTQCSAMEWIEARVAVPGIVKLKANTLVSY